MSSEYSSQNEVKQVQDGEIMQVNDFLLTGDRKNIVSKDQHHRRACAVAKKNANEATSSSFRKRSNKLLGASKYLAGQNGSRSVEGLVGGNSAADTHRSQERSSALQSTSGSGEKVTVAVKVPLI